VRRWVLATVACGLAVAGCGGGGSTSASRGQIVLTSPDFKAGAAIPARFTCSGANVSPELTWRHVPRGATQLEVSVVDEDADGFVHWSVRGLPPRARGVRGGHVLPPGAREGRNGFGKVGWSGPCPPRGDAAHHYLFTVTALGQGGKVLDHGSLVATFKR
jgi:Raf kinase inhibitor-like YbhB/YbcL family protein